MSGHTGNTKCGKCGELAEFYVESPPVPCLIVSCTNYKCGFKYYFEDGKDISYYQEKSEIKELREILIGENEEKDMKFEDMKFEIHINDIHYPIIT